MLDLFENGINIIKSQHTHTQHIYIDADIQREFILTCNQLILTVLPLSLCTNSLTDTNARAHEHGKSRPVRFMGKIPMQCIACAWQFFIIILCACTWRERKTIRNTNAFNDIHITRTSMKMCLNRNKIPK